MFGLDALIDRDARRSQSHQASVHRKANAAPALPSVAQHSYRDGHDHIVIQTLPEVWRGLCN